MATLFLAHSPAAAWTAQEVEEPYAVAGRTGFELYSSIGERGPSAGASRAIAVVQYLIGKGLPPQRLVAAGFGEFQPIDPGTTEEAYSRNRRIELKLTER